jgi:hypothetical protein
MTEEGLRKEVEPAIDPRQLTALRDKIAMLQVVYFVLFGCSLLLIIVNYQSHAGLYMHVLWAGSLLGAVGVRLYRQSQVSKYNSLLLGGRPAPLS